jgi:ribose transport system permease protein
VSTVDTPVASSNEAPPPPPLRRIASFAGNQQFILFLVLVGVMCFFDFHNTRFFTTSEFTNLLVDFCEAVLIAAAEMYVISSGGIDLSVGSTIAVSGVVGAYAIQYLENHHFGEFPSLLVGTFACAGVGAVVGSINALLITKARLVPFVATLVTLSMGEGLALVFSKGGTVGYDPAAAGWSSTGFWIFRWLTVMVLVLTIILGIVLHVSRYGRYNFAIGSNPFAARAAGINVSRHIASVYILSGVLAGLTGMIFYFNSSGGAPQNGIGNELYAIAAVVIGGVSLFGGSGRFTGIIIGVAILTVVQDGLVFINVATTWNEVVVAGIIALATILQSMRPGAKRLL